MMTGTAASEARHRHVPQTQLRPSRSALREPQFARYLAGQTVSGLGDQIWYVALAWSAVHAASPAVAGVLLMLSSIPRLALLLFGGLIADRFDIRRLMMGSDTLRTVLTLASAGIALAASGVWLLVLLALTFGAVDAVFMPSAGAMQPRLLRPEQYKAGSVAVQMTARLALCLGAPLGGIVMALGHLSFALAVDGVTFAVSVATLATVRPRPLVRQRGEGQAERPGYLADLRRGLGFLVGHPVLGPLTLVVTLSNLGFVGPMNIGLAELAAHHGWGPAGIGVLLAAFGIGAAVSALAMYWRRIRRRAGVWLTVLVAVQGAAIMSMGLAPRLALAVLAATVVGVCSGPVAVISSVLSQVATPDDLRGRVSSITTLSAYGTVLIASSATGLLIGTLGLTGTYAISGSIELVALVVLAFPGLRQARIES
jgi:MFS family permease